MGGVVGGVLEVIKRLERVVYRWLMNTLTLLMSAAYVVSDDVPCRACNVIGMVRGQ